MIWINFNKSGVYYAQNISSSLTTSPGHFRLLFHLLLHLKVLPHSACVIQICSYLQENASSAIETEPGERSAWPGLCCSGAESQFPPGAVTPALLLGTSTDDAPGLGEKLCCLSLSPLESTVCICNAKQTWFQNLISLTTKAVED